MGRHCVLYPATTIKFHLAFQDLRERILFSVGLLAEIRWSKHTVQVQVQVQPKR